MGRETRLFKSEERATVAYVADFLRLLADKVATGSVTLIQGNQEITLTLPEMVELEVQVEDEFNRRGEVKHSLEVEIAWGDGDDQAVGGVKLS